MQARTSASSMTLGARDQIVKRCLIVDAVVGLQRSRHALDREPVPLDQRGNFLLLSGKHLCIWFCMALSIVTLAAPFGTGLPSLRQAIL